MSENNSPNNSSLYYSIMDSEISNINDDSTLKDDANDTSSTLDSSQFQRTLRSGKKSTLYEKSLLRSAVLSSNTPRGLKMAQLAVMGNSPKPGKSPKKQKSPIRSSTPNPSAIPVIKPEPENDINSPNKVPKMVTFKEKDNIIPQVMITSQEEVPTTDEKERTRIEYDENDQIVIENGVKWLDIKETAPSPRKLLQSLVKDEKESLESVLPPPLDGSVLSLTEVPETPSTEKVDFEQFIPQSQIKSYKVPIFDISSGGEADTELASSFTNSPDFPNVNDPEELFEQQARAKLPDEVEASVTELDKKPAIKRKSMIPTKRETISTQYRNNHGKKTTEAGEVRPPVRTWNKPEPAVEQKPAAELKQAVEAKNTGAIRKTTINHRRTMQPTTTASNTRRTMVQPTPSSSESAAEKPKVTLNSRRSLHPAALRPTTSAPATVKPKTPVFKINKIRSSGVGVSPAGRMSLGKSKLGGGASKVTRKTMLPSVSGARTANNRSARKSLGGGSKQYQARKSIVPKVIPKITVQKPESNSTTSAIKVQPPKKPQPPHYSQAQKRAVSSGTVCIYCDKKFAISKALELHQLDKCTKIPPAAKKLLLAKQRACREEALNHRSYRTNPSNDASTASNTDCFDMPPPQAKGLVKSSVKDGSLQRTPSKKLMCKPCNLKFPNVLQFSNHVADTHMPKTCSESSEFETE